MILILLSFCYILFTTLNFGFLFDKIFKLKSDNFIIINILGLFATTILTTFWAIFGRINIEFHIFLLILNLAIGLKFYSEIKNCYKNFLFELKMISSNLQLFLAIISALILAQCSAAPYLADNESYYIQTIKWLNEFGLVKGLVNLHIFLGQTSAWHICQSAFSFSFLYKNFNDLSGFCLLLGNIFAIQKLDLYFKKGNKNNLIIGLIPIFNLLFFRFISSPSPDIPTYVFTIIVFYYFIENFKNISVEVFKLITILVLFILFMKTTSAAIILIPIVLFGLNFKKILPKSIPIIIISIIVLSLYITKNLIVTGYPFYPIQFFRSNQDYTIPEIMIRFLYESTRLDAFYLTQQQFDSMNYFQLAKQWISLSIVDTFFDSLTVITIVICPFFIYKFKNEKSVWLIYFVVIIQMVLMFLTSPQYRYFIHFILFFDMVIFSILFAKKVFILGSIYISSVAIALVLFVPLNFKSLTTNEFITSNDNFYFKNIIFPNQNSKNETAYISFQKGNLKYNSPVKNSFFWGSSNGDLPAINQKQIEYFEQYYFVIPQQRTKDLKEGFYAKEINR